MTFSECLRSSKLHLALTVVWALLVIPTITIWKDAVWWIGLISIYANVVSHWTTYIAARTAEKTEKSKRK